MNSEFKPITVTTKQSQRCVTCNKEHKTGAEVLAKFRKSYSGTVTTIVCDELCLIEHRTKSSSLENFLSRRSVQFN